MRLLRKKLFGMLLGILLVLCFRRLGSRFWHDDLVITFFDVGQGDSALIEFPRGKTMLVDAGGGFGAWNLGTRELFPELARMGILHLNFALLSHPDQDHGYGFEGILKELSVDEFWYNQIFERETHKKKLFESLRAMALQGGTRLRPFEHTESLDIGGVEVRLIPLSSEKRTTNNRSLVLFLDFYGCTSLFTGDIETLGEENLRRISLPRINILKVAHHGSKTSSTVDFLRSISPQIAVISAGLGNRYGHPHRDAIQRLLQQHLQLFRTDFHGYVRFSISANHQIHCETSHGSCGTAKCGG